MFNYKNNVRTLFLDLCSTEYLIKMLYIKNEKNNTERIMEGILKCHSYFFKNDGSNYIYEVYDFSYNTIVQRFILYLRIKIVNIIIFFIKYAYYLNKKNNNFKWISIYFKNLIQNILLYNSN